MSQDKEVIEVEQNAGLETFMASGLDAALAKEKEIMSLNATYLEMKKGESKKLVLVNMTSWEKTDTETGEIKRIPSAVLIGEDKETYVSSQTVIVQACNAAPMYSTIMVTYKGDKNLGGGRKLAEFDVKLLG